MSKNYSLKTLFVFFPLIIFWIFIFLYTTDVPWFDDIETFGDTLRIWITSDLLTGIKELFHPNNEHRMFPGKFWAVLYYLFTGKIDFRILTFIGNLNLMGTVFLFWKVFKRGNHSIWYFLPITLFLCQPQYYLTSLWIITSWQHEGVLFAGIFTLYLVSRNTTKTYLWACLAILYTIFTMSNGLFFGIAGAFILLLQNRIKELAIWLGVWVVGVGLYFYGFNNQANGHGLEYFMQHPHESVFGFFTFLGGSFDFMPKWDIVKRSVFPTIMGFILVSTCLYISWNLIKKHSVALRKWVGTNGDNNQNTTQSNDIYFVIGCLVFLLCNAFIIGLLRPRFGYHVMLVVNYKIYPSHLLAVAYLLILFYLPHRQKLLNGILVFALLFSSYSYLTITKEASDRHRKMLVGAYNQQHNDIGLAAEIHSPFAAYTTKIMGYLISNKLYEYPTFFDAQQIKAPLINAPLTTGEVSVKKLSADASVIVIKHIAAGNSYQDGVYILLQAPERTYLVFADSENGHDFSSEISNKFFEKGLYQIGMFQVKNGVQQSFKTNQTLVIE
jgi:hypothetical protein